MAKIWILFLIIILSVLCKISAEDACPGDTYKCTSKDPRTIYPRCMLYGVDWSLWCDQSNYSKVPDPDQIVSFMPCSIATALYINDSCLREIEPDHLQKYRHIEVFKCASNFVKKVPKNLFRWNKNLTAVDFCTNAIDTVEVGAFAGLTKLERLNLSNNDINKVSPGVVSGLVSLEYLSFHNNRIKGIHKKAFRDLPRLRKLTLTANRISIIDEDLFEDLPSLTHLHLDQNELTGFAGRTFHKLTKLEVLTVSYNRIKSWPSRHLTSVHTINLAFNEITEIEKIDISNMMNLQNLNIKGNLLTTFQDSLFPEGSHLRHLDASGNNLNEVGRYAFSHLCHLQTLLLHNNNLTKPYPEWFKKPFSKGNYEDNDIRGNPWHCDCDLIEFQEFLEQTSWLQQRETVSEKLEIVCESPEEVKGHDLDSKTRETVLGIAGCATINKQPEVACGSGSLFDVHTELFEYHKIKRCHGDRGRTPTTTTHPNKPKSEFEPNPLPAIIITCFAVFLAVFLLGAYAVSDILSRMKGKKLEKDVDSFDKFHTPFIPKRNQYPNHSRSDTFVKM